MGFAVCFQISFLD